MDKYVGKKLDGRYEIRELIGIGGMANVYRCYDTIDDREVAIKILKDEFLNNEEFIRRFKNESKAIAVLSHPNIVKVYDVSFGDMIQYIVMEYIDGITLKEYINQQNVLTWKETVHLITQVLAALQHAHSKGVVHRDIKPQNMMLLSDGTIKVTDFGIARFSNATRTMTEQAIGSVHYIAPEQAKGDITDGKTDIYSIGIMMYEMLTGKLPFDGENAVSVALMHLQIVPDNPRTINPSIPEGIEEIILKAMQKQPVDRYQSAQDMLLDIERFRMNPSVRFEYKYLYDKQPTKYIDAVNKGKTHRAEEYAKVVNPDDDDEKVRHSVTIPIVMGILIALCISVVVCVTVGLFKGSSVTTDTLSVEAPNVVDMTESEATAFIKENYKFQVEVINLYNSEKYKGQGKNGLVVEQDPPVGEKLKETGKIVLTVYYDDHEAIVPQVVGMHVNQAMSTLTSHDFREWSVEYVYSERTEGEILATYPQAESTSRISQTVFLYVATNKVDAESVSFNYSSLVGKTLEEAKEILVPLGYSEENITVATSRISNSNIAADRVVFADYLCKEFDKDSLAEQKVALYLSDGTPYRTIYVDIDNVTNNSLPSDTVVQLKFDGEDDFYQFSVGSAGSTETSYTTEIPYGYLSEGKIPVVDPDGKRESGVTVQIYLTLGEWQQIVTYEINFDDYSYNPIASTGSIGGPVEETTENTEATENY